MDYNIENSDIKKTISFPKKDYSGLHYLAKDGAIKCYEIIHDKLFKYVAFCSDEEWKTFIKNVKKDKISKYKDIALNIKKILESFYSNLFSYDTRYIFMDYFSYLKPAKTPMPSYDVYEDIRKSKKYFTPEYRDYLTHELENKVAKRKVELDYATYHYEEKKKFSLKRSFSDNLFPILAFVFLIIGVASFLFIPIFEIFNPLFLLIPITSLFIAGFFGNVE